MSEHDRDRERREPRVKFTDRRRVRPDEGEPVSAPDAPGVELGGDGGEAEELGPPAETAELEEAKRQAAEYLEHLRRLQAEFANYKKRVLREQTRAVEMASEPMVARLLEVLDEFDLALIAAEQRPDFDKFLHGVELVYAKLKDILASEGLHRIDAEGKPFDPQLHEALLQTGSGDGEAVVSDVLRPGYTLKGRVIRPAGVKVTRK
jgi:molecular chaperone GrpE